MKRFIYSSVCASSMSHQLCSAESQGMKSPFPAGLGLLPKLSRLQAHTRHSTLTQGCLAPGWAAGQGMKLGWALLNTDKLWWALGGPPAREQLLSSAIPGIIFRSFLPTLRCTFLTVLYQLFNNYLLYFYSKQGAIFSSILHEKIKLIKLSHFCYFSFRTFKCFLTLQVKF